MRGGSTTRSAVFGGTPPARKRQAEWVRECSNVGDVWKDLVRCDCTAPGEWWHWQQASRVQRYAKRPPARDAGAERADALSRLLREDRLLELFEKYRVTGGREIEELLDVVLRVLERVLFEQEGTERLL